MVNAGNMGKLTGGPVDLEGEGSGAGPKTVDEWAAEVAEAWQGKPLCDAGAGFALLGRLDQATDEALLEIVAARVSMIWMPSLRRLRDRGFDVAGLVPRVAEDVAVTVVPLTGAPEEGHHLPAALLCQLERDQISRPDIVSAGSTNQGARQ